VRWGPKNALQFSFLVHLVMWGLLVLFGVVNRFRVPYFTGVFIILISLLLEHWLARRRSINWVNVAFFRLNALISIVFLTTTIASVVFIPFKWTPLK
jgi:4-hydroxybenzoate polyprenyltransferase